MRASIDALVSNLERQVVGYREKRRLERRRRTEHHGI
jgi:ribosome-associated translation inhibitor RaiA